MFKKKSGEVTILLEQATAVEQPDVDWDLLFQAADLVRQDHGAEAAKALRTRLKNKSPVVQNYALICIDVLYKNCAGYFQVPFLDGKDSLKKIVINPYFVDHSRVRIAQCVAEWRATNLDPIKARILDNLLAYFNTHGFFPRMPQAAVHIQQPFTQHNLGSQVHIGNPSYPGHHHPQPMHLQQQYLTTPFYPTTHHVPAIVTFEQRKIIIERDLELAENNTRLFAEAMSFAVPGEDVTKNELIQEFRTKCMEIQRRLIPLITEIDDGDLLGLMVKINEDISQILEKYDFRVNYFNRQSRIREEHEEAENIFADPPENVNRDVNPDHYSLSPQDIDHLARVKTKGKEPVTSSSSSSSSSFAGQAPQGPQPYMLQTQFAAPQLPPLFPPRNLPTHLQTQQYPPAQYPAA
ncbi:hypothetical protein DFJ77DRAFT_463839 [Powellomyces hirtus]|nr:hypothetical protein DFJ77DRAFT_463839 [Powellomyces hirtus]